MFLNFTINHRKMPKIHFFILINVLSATSQYSNTFLEDGKVQYELLQERGKLPKYGTCWTQAILQIEEGCHALSENAQAEMALQLTNCFLEMSGHETYNCNADKKVNLRKICMSSMNDRAFNVYTEFYTHTQNICWFLKGQIWQEVISENTIKVGKYLEVSVANQKKLLENQRTTLELQERLMNYSTQLEDVLHNFLAVTTKHQKVFQSWILGEITWIDTLIFYITISIFLFMFTSVKRTASARIPLIALLTINILMERCLSHILSHNIFPSSIKDVHSSYYTYVWYLRYIFIFLSFTIILVSSYIYIDYNKSNFLLLENLGEEVQKILKQLKENKQIEYANVNEVNNSINQSYNDISNKENSIASKLNDHLHKKPFRQVQNNIKYNLRSRQGTPDMNIF